MDSKCLRTMKKMKLKVKTKSCSTKMELEGQEEKEWILSSQKNIKLALLFLFSFQSFLHSFNCLKFHFRKVSLVKISYSYLQPRTSIAQSWRKLVKLLELFWLISEIKSPKEGLIFMKLKHYQNHSDRIASCVVFTWNSQDLRMMKIM